MNTDDDSSTSQLSVKKSLVRFIELETGEDATDMIDEILLSYVVGILESDIAEEGFDVLEFKEMLSAYIPSFDSILDAKISSWVGLLSSEVNKRRRQIRVASKQLEAITSMSPNGRTPPFSAEPRKTSHKSSTSRSRNTSQSEDDIGKPNHIAICDESSLCDEVTFRTLCEMFPGACALEVRRCLMVAGGDSEAAAQLLLQRDGLAESLLTGTTNGAVHSKRDMASLALGERELRAQILTRYGYIDQDEDGKEHRPVAPKTEPKKLIRYRDNKIVSVKGEKYSEVKREESDDMKRTYVTLKPARQYRFH